MPVSPTIKCLVRPVLLAALLTVTAQHHAFAQDGKRVTRQQAIDRAIDQNGGSGKVLGVREIEDDSGRAMYAVKIISNGRVRVFRIPMAAGKP